MIFLHARSIVPSQLGKQNLPMWTMFLLYVIDFRVKIFGRLSKNAHTHYFKQ